MDKAPNFGLPFFYRVVIPGVVMLAALHPLLLRWIDASPRIQPYEGVIMLGAAVLFGFLLSISDDFIYEFYEGRRGWPPPLVQWRTRRWKAHATRLLALAQNPADPRFNTRWAELSQFPMELGEDNLRRPTATAPTRMGNVLAGYEQYPQLRYGMAPAFYWERLWMLLDKDVRKDIDERWAPTDTLMYSAFGLVICGVIYAIVALAGLLSANFGSTWLRRERRDTKKLSALEVDDAVRRLSTRITELESLRDANERWDNPKADRVARAIEQSVRDAFPGGDIEQDYRYHRIQYGPQNVADDDEDHQGQFVAGIERDIEGLRGLTQLLEQQRERPRDRDEEADDREYGRNVFLVHGQNAGIKEEVARFVERLGIEVMILHEKANEGRTLIEKFERHALLQPLQSRRDLGAATGVERLFLQRCEKRGKGGLFHRPS